MSRQIIHAGRQPAFVVIPIESAAHRGHARGRTDAAAVRAFLRDPTETFPDAVVSAILAVPSAQGAA